MKSTISSPAGTAIPFPARGSAEKRSTQIPEMGSLSPSGKTALFLQGRDIPPDARVLMAMSGGVDSSVAAHRLLDAGLIVIGVTMHLAKEKDCAGLADSRGGEKACCSIGAAWEARKVAQQLGIEHHTIDLTKEFDEKVIQPTRYGYTQGITPNPCVMCNRYIKFDALFNYATKYNCRYVATGHYARITEDPSGLHLLRGFDAIKDQSYFLSYLTDKRLDSIIFPLGRETKETVRADAHALGLKVADRPESQDLCFFIERNGSTVEKPCGENEGEIILTDGTVIGHHSGISGYTIGQRKGLPGGQLEPLYVVDIDPATNRVVVGMEMESYFSKFQVVDLSLVSPDRDEVRFNDELLVQYRYRTRPAPAKVTLEEFASAQVDLKEPARAVTRGQIATFYSNDEVLGAGTIWKTSK